jgi:hypothetical protein
MAQVVGLTAAVAARAGWRSAAAAGVSSSRIKPKEKEGEERSAALASTDARI